ncbi:MAG: RNA-directed DNA polymerase [Alistipes sp.]|nr:RNA-directed DNA polymerase [Alistipes sp.]MBR6648749.1 RNA-directed DNA polymerase [Bacteroidaceae bacterium]
MSYYITVNREPRVYQLTFEDIMYGLDESKLALQKDTRDTTTWKVDAINRRLIEKTDFNAMQAALRGFVERYQDLIAVEDKSTLYRSFKIPKRSGGLRQIDAPNDELKRALYDLKMIFEKKFYMSYHTAAFAYVHGRSTIDSVKRHQQNKSRWFLKTDMRHFFPSTSPEFLMKMLCMTFPFCAFIEDDWGNRELLEKALSLCFLNGGLPQGTPTSPMLTNALMIPIDHAISKMCHEYQPHLCYTRYADDILISSEYSFKWTDVQNKLIAILNSFEAPFSLHPDKTRYGSSAGRNWNLGVMLNAENKITIGHEKKKVFKAMVFQFMTDDAKGVAWGLEDVQHFLGLISYYRMVEKENIDAILATYSAKFNKDVEATAKALLKP